MIRRVLTAALLAGTSLSTVALAEEVRRIDAVSVTGSSSGDDDALVVADPQPNPKSTVTKQGITLLGGAGQTSQYKPLSLMPSINEESPDPYGFSSTRNINIRGKSDFHLGRTYNGLPVMGLVGGADLFDLENVEQIDAYRGSMQANQGLGMNNASGAIDQRLLGPQDAFTTSGKQALGSFDFHKTYARVDSGTIAATGTKLFVSGSDSSADKWKGEGDSPSERRNFMMGVSQPLGERVKLDASVVYNKFAGHTFRPLTYAQSQNMRDFYRYDYNGALTGVSSTDANYYDFNRVKSEDLAALADVEITLARDHRLNIKPYYWDNNGVQYSASGNNVQVWHQQHDNYGGVIEYNGHYGAATDVTLGYWAQSMEAPPPPTDQKLYTVTPGGGLRFLRWNTLAKIDRFEATSPYAQVSQTFGSTYLTGGMRYMTLGAPNMQYYNTSGLPDVSYDQIWAFNPTAYADANVKAKDYTELLPNFGIRQELTPAWSVSASYSRKFGRPDWGPQASNYISNRTSFQARGISLQDLVDKVKPELSDQVDLSLRYNADGLTVVPTLFGSKNQNRQVMVTDPGLGGLSYYQGTAETTQYGAELEVAYQLNGEWTVFGSGTLASETYDSDTPTLSGGAALATQGKQIANAPRTMLKGGVTYQWNDLSLSPVVRYVGKRYGDSVQTQKVDAYTVMDFTASYNLGREVGLDTLSAALSIQNVFDRKYISEISANDFNLNSSTSYYVAPPRTIVGTLSVKF